MLQAESKESITTSLKVVGRIGTHDPTIKALTLAANKDFNHPRRCQGIWKGERCKYWALKGEIYCKPRHFKMVLAQRKGRVAAQLTHSVNGITDMAQINFYKHRIGPRLSERLAQLAAAPLHEKLSLSQELDIMRDLAGESLALYSAAIELPNDKPNKEQIVSSAICLMQQSLEQVRVYCKTAAEIENMSKDKISVHDIQDLVNQICRMVRACFGDYQSELAAFEQLIHNEIVLPESGNKGTNLTPDLDVLEMDETIPIE